MKITETFCDGCGVNSEDRKVSEIDSGDWCQRCRPRIGKAKKRLTFKEKFEILRRLLIKTSENQDLEAQIIKELEKRIERGKIGTGKWDEVPIDSAAFGLRDKTRALNILSWIGIKTVGDLIRCNPNEIQHHKNCGYRTMRDIKWALEDAGLNFLAYEKGVIHE